MQEKTENCRGIVKGYQLPPETPNPPAEPGEDAWSALTRRPVPVDLSRRIVQGTRRALEREASESGVQLDLPPALLALPWPNVPAGWNQQGTLRAIGALAATGSPLVAPQSAPGAP